MKETGKRNQENTFEEALQKLERAVEKLDEGSLSLEEALSTFEDGVRWSRECHQFLEKAEERVIQSATRSVRVLLVLVLLYLRTTL